MNNKNIELRNNIIEYINDCYFNRGVNPTVQEIATHFRKSKSNLYVHLRNMYKDGFLV